MVFGILSRRDWWPGPEPTIQKGRTMCSDCRFHRMAHAGWQWDRCENPAADLGSVVRNDQTPTCADMRNSSAQCGSGAKWFEPKQSKGGRAAQKAPASNQ